MIRHEFLTYFSALAATGIYWPDHLLADESGIKTDRHGSLLPTRALGDTGDRVTLLGLGGQHFRRLPEKDVQPCIELAIEGGIRFFDTANAYGKKQLVRAAVWAVSDPEVSG